VGGSDLAKAKEQLGEDYLELVDWGFPENGLNAFKDGKSIAVQSLKKYLGDENINRFINFVLRYLSEGMPLRRRSASC
jgi:phosphomannomutase